MIASYHNHSTFSDGKATIAQIVDHAKTVGIDELGVSDHLCMCPSGECPAWAMAPDQLSRYVDELQLAQQRDGKPSIRIGLEACWFPQQQNVIERVIEALPLDFLIGSVHEVDGYGVDGSARGWEQFTPTAREQVHRRYWELMKTLADSRLFDIVAHLDLPKKFGYRAQSDLSDVVGSALDAIAEADMVVELNTAGWHKPCADAYPTLDILRQCRTRDIAVMISADAHQPEHLLRDFDRAAARLQEAGYREVARFRERKAQMEPLDAATAD